MVTREGLSLRIKRLRVDNELTQKDLAKTLHISEQAISKWERSEAIPDMDKIRQLSNVFDVSTDFLLNGTEYKPKESLSYWQQLVNYSPVNLFKETIKNLIANDEINIYKDKDIYQRTLLETIVHQENYPLLKEFMKIADSETAFNHYSDLRQLVRIALMNNDSSLLDFALILHEKKYHKPFSFDNPLIKETICNHELSDKILNVIFSVRFSDDKPRISNITFPLNILEYIIESKSDCNVIKIMNLLIKSNKENKLNYLSIYKSAVISNHEKAIQYLIDNGNKLLLYEQAIENANQTLMTQFAKFDFNNEEKERINTNIQKYLNLYLRRITRKYKGDKVIKDLKELDQEIAFVYDYLNLPASPQELYLMNKIAEFKDSVKAIPEMKLIIDLRHKPIQTFKTLQNNYDFGESWKKRGLEASNPDYVDHDNFIEETIDLLQKEAAPHIKVQEGFKQHFNDLGFLGLKIAVLIKDIETIKFIKQFALKEQLEDFIAETKFNSVINALTT